MSCHSAQAPRGVPQLSGHRVTIWSHLTEALLHPVGRGLVAHSAPAFHFSQQVCTWVWCAREPPLSWCTGLQHHYLCPLPSLCPPHPHTKVRTTLNFILRTFYVLLLQIRFGFTGGVSRAWPSCTSCSPELTSVNLICNFKS